MKHFLVRKPVVIALLGLVLLGWTTAYAAETSKTLYVSSAKAPVYKKPSIQSQKLFVLSAGTPVRLLDEQGFWYLIAHHEQQGWIFKIMVKGNPPILKQNINVTQLAELKSRARRRPSAYTATAAARGLKRKRDRFADRYRQDYFELKKIESLKIPVKEADQFIQDGVSHETKP